MDHDTGSLRERTGGSEYDVDVVVVGAGPIGLALACALLHHGVRCRIFERREGQSEESKGHNLNARSQELLESIGVRGAIAAKAYPAPDAQILIEGKPLARLATRGSGSPYDVALFSSQAAIEGVLADAIGEHGGRVERGRPVLGIDGDPDGVDIVVGHAGDGSDDADRDRERELREPERLRCRYLVGADGVRGTVRKAIGLDFALTELEGRATRQIDAKLTWQRSTDLDQAWFFLYRDGFAGVMPVWEGLYRLFFLEDEARMPEREPTLDEMVERAREVIGDETFSLTDPVWFSYGRFSHGVAAAYSKERVFLAGDAGHHTLPIGGQGMNAGFHDAIGLAWRLAMTLAGEGGPTVLGSYGPERQGAHAELGEQQVRGFKQLMYRGRVTDAAIKSVAGLIPNLGSHVFGGSDLQQLTVAYPKSALSEDRFSSLNPTRRAAPRAGDRAPDARVTTQGGKAIRLFERIYNPDGLSWGWRLLAFDGRERDAHGDLSRALQGLAAWSWVRPHVVLADPGGAGGELGAMACLFDLDGVAHDAYGLEGAPALVLIRPDGHIAFRSPLDDVEQLLAYCRMVVGPPRLDEV